MADGRTFADRLLLRWRHCRSLGYFIGGTLHDIWASLKRIPISASAGQLRNWASANRKRLAITSTIVIVLGLLGAYADRRDKLAADWEKANPRLRNWTDETGSQYEDLYGFEGVGEYGVHKRLLSKRKITFKSGEVWKAEYEVVDGQSETTKQTIYLREKDCPFNPYEEGPLTHSGKRHGHWKRFAYDDHSIIPSRVFDSWYWYGEEVSEGELALRSK